LKQVTKEPINMQWNGKCSWVEWSIVQNRSHIKLDVPNAHTHWCYSLYSITLQHPLLHTCKVGYLLALPTKAKDILCLDSL
jgi:hypothetical protein